MIGDVIDVAWGISFIAGIAAMQLVRPSFAPVILLVDGLVVIWGARLASHIYCRFRRSSTQDERYSNLLRTWPKQHWKLQLLDDCSSSKPSWPRASASP